MDTAFPPQAFRAAVAETVERRLLLSGTTETFTPLVGGDFNGDGSNESLVRVSAGRARLASLGFVGGTFRRGSLLLLDDSGTLFGDPLGLRASGRAAPLVAAADFNSDGRLDLVIGGRRLRGAGRGLTFLAGNGDGTFAGGTPVGGAPANVTSLVAGDVNGDGRADLIGTARGRNLGGNRTSGSAGALTFAIREDRENPGDNQGTAVDLGPTDFGAHRPHLAGASAEAGGGVVSSSTLLPSGSQSGLGGIAFADSALGGSPVDVDVSLAPGFTPPASRIGVSAEAGGGRLGGFADLFFDGDSLSDQTFVLFGNGNGMFSLSDNTIVD